MAAAMFILTATRHRQRHPGEGRSNFGNHDGHAGAAITA